MGPNNITFLRHKGHLTKRSDYKLIMPFTCYHEGAFDQLYYVVKMALIELLPNCSLSACNQVFKVIKSFYSKTARWIFSFLQQKLSANTLTKALL